MKRPGPIGKIERTGFRARLERYRLMYVNRFKYLLSYPEHLKIATTAYNKAMKDLPAETRKLTEDSGKKRVSVSQTYKYKLFDFLTRGVSKTEEQNRCKIDVQIHKKEGIKTVAIVAVKYSGKMGEMKVKFRRR